VILIEIKGLIAVVTSLGQFQKKTPRSESGLARVAQEVLWWTCGLRYG
jgi:hypothetical protein